MNMLARLGNLLRRENGHGRQTRERVKKADIQPHIQSSKNKRFRRKNRVAGETSPPTALVPKKEVKQQVDLLSSQLDQVSTETKELRECLISITEGSPDTNSVPSQRPTPLLEKIKMEHKQVMADLQRLEKENSKAFTKFQEVDEGSLFYCHLQQQLHMEKTQLHNVVDKLRQETEKVLGEWILLQHYLGQLKVIFEEEEKHIRDFQTHGQQEKQRLEDNLQSQEKERKLVNQKKRFAEKLQHYLTVSLMRSEKLQHELEQVSGQEESLMKTEMLQQGH